MKKIQAEVIIHAPSEIVWDHFIRFSKYVEWNPFLINLEGKIAVGEKLKGLVQSPGAKPRVFYPILKEIQEGESLSWLGVFYFKGLFDGHHHFEIKKLSQNKTLFHQWEIFKGILVPLNPHIINGIQGGFVAMNEALKKRVEGV